jgi:ribonuclease HI
VAEYEALVLGLRAAKDMGIEEISVFGDAELIVHQIKNIYQAKRSCSNRRRVSKNGSTSMPCRAQQGRTGSLWIRMG